MNVDLMGYRGGRPVNYTRIAFDDNHQRLFSVRSDDQLAIKREEIMARRDAEIMALVARYGIDEKRAGKVVDDLISLPKALKTAALQTRIFTIR